MKLPTKDLPWAHPMNSITSATVSGIGQTPLGVVEGTWVVGFFTDGHTAQQPIIMGTLPGVPKNLPTHVKADGKGVSMVKVFKIICMVHFLNILKQTLID